MKLYPIQKGRDGRFMAAGTINGRHFIASGNSIEEARKLRSQQMLISLGNISEALCLHQKTI